MGLVAPCLRVVSALEVTGGTASGLYSGVLKRAVCMRSLRILICGLSVFSGWAIIESLMYFLSDS